MRRLIHDDLDELVAALGGYDEEDKDDRPGGCAAEAPVGAGGGTATCGTGNTPVELDPAMLERRAGSYAEKMALRPAVAGDDGHTRLIQMVGMCRDFGLTREATERVFRERFNPACVPPWEEKDWHEVGHKLDEVFGRPIDESRFLAEIREQQRQKQQRRADYLAHNARPPQQRVATVDDLVDPCATGNDGASTEPPFGIMTMADFLAADFKKEWHVEDLLLKNETCVVGAPQKALKTTTMVDLAIGLSSGCSVLGHFRVPERRRVLLLSGESGQATLQETARRIIAARSIEEPASMSAMLGFELPQLCLDADLATLRRFIRTNRIEVLIYDPLYLGLLAGAGPDAPDPANLYKMGPHLRTVTCTCLDEGCTPILVHHFKLGRRDPEGEPQLEDLAYAGIGAFARQWILMGRREPYVPGSGAHRLWFSVGGSGHSGGLWQLDVQEGVMQRDFTGRRWDVTLTPTNPAKHKQDVRSRKAIAKNEAKMREEKQDDERILALLDKWDPNGHGLTRNRLRDWAGGQPSRERVFQAVSRLLDDGILEEVEVVVQTANSAKRKDVGVRRKPL